MHTGHPHHPGKYLRAGDLEVIAETSETATSVPFINGVALISTEGLPAVLGVVITVKRAQRERLVVQHVEISWE